MLGTYVGHPSHRAFMGVQVWEMNEDRKGRIRGDVTASSRPLSIDSLLDERASCSVARPCRS
jgi:hypothetical protein